MSVTFTKLFASITESTVWCEPDATRLCWITMLAMSDSKGRVWGSIPGLANRARVSVDAARTAINTFLSPDPDSRSKTADGRRIEPIEGGWRLINHEKYRAIRDEESIKEAKRKYINDRRKKQREGKIVDQSVENSIDCRSQSNSVDQSRSDVGLGRANAEADTEADTEKEESKPKTLVALLSEDGIPEDLAKEFVSYRSSLGAKLTPRAWLGIKREIGKANMTLEAGITMMMARAWRGFDASWVTKQPVSGGRAFSC